MENCLFSEEMEGQEDGETFYGGNSNSEDPKDTVSLPVGKKNMQVNFFKDRASGMYKCQMCSYKSMHRSSIKSHYAVHSSLRPYACDQCSYEAKRLNDLRKHKLIKHGKKLLSIRKKHASNYESSRSQTNGIPESSKYNADSDNNDSHMEDKEVDGASGNLLYQSLLGTASSNGPVFPQPEPASLLSSPDTCNVNSPPRHEQPISTGDIPDEVDKEGTMVVKPEPPDDYYTFQNKFPEHDDPIVIPPNPPAHSEAIKPSSSPSKSPGHEITSPTAALKSVAQSTCKDGSESEVTRLHAASPSVISLLLQRRNLTGSSLMSPTALNQSAPSPSQPKPLKPVQRHAVHSNSSSNNFYTADSASRFSAPQYNPLNLSYQQPPTRSSSESSSHSSLPSSTSGRSRGVETNRGWGCDHCNIMFFDSAIYFMHMGLHSPDNAWQCNLCGQQLYDVYSFTSHFVNGHVSA